MDFPEDWPLPMRRIVRAGDRKLRRWEDQHEEGAPLDKVARVGSQCLTKMRETLPELYEDEVPESWWARWQRGEIGREIYLLLCGETPRPMRENGEKHNYLRRVPTKNSNRNFRYIYDPKKAFPKTRKKPPRKQEKLLVTHAGKRGHYEVEAVEDGKAIVQHDETGHRMSIEGDKLYKLFKDANDTLQAEKRLTKLEKEDRLPRSRADAYYYIQQVSGIGDHDSAPNDVAYRKWKQGGKRGKKPPPMERGGLLEPFSGDKRRGKKGAKKPYSSLLEAFEDATKGAKTWRDILPAFEKLKEVPGFEEARLPDEVYERHALQDEILKEEEVMSADPEKYGETLVSTEEQEPEAPEAPEAPAKAGLVDEQGFDWSTGEQTYTDWTDEILNDPFYEDPI